MLSLPHNMISFWDIIKGRGLHSSLRENSYSLHIAVHQRITPPNLFISYLKSLKI